VRVEWNAFLGLGADTKKTHNSKSTFDENHHEIKVTYEFD